MGGGLSLASRHKDGRGPSWLRGSKLSVPPDRHWDEDGDEDAGGEGEQRGAPESRSLASRTTWSARRPPRCCLARATVQKTQGSGCSRVPIKRYLQREGNGPDVAQICQPRGRVFRVTSFHRCPDEASTALPTPVSRGASRCTGSESFLAPGPRLCLLSAASAERRARSPQPRPCNGDEAGAHFSGVVTGRLEGKPLKGWGRLLPPTTESELTNAHTEASHYYWMLF